MITFNELVYRYGNYSDRKEADFSKEEYQNSRIGVLENEVELLTKAIFNTNKMEKGE